MDNKMDVMTALEIAIDMLDRVEGTELYKIQKKFYGYTDKEWDSMLSQLNTMYEYIKKKRGKNGRE